MADHETTPIEQIQATLSGVADRLEQLTRELRLPELMAELEEHYPGDMDMEAVGEGEVCPPLAWDVHADVGNAAVLLEEVLVSLRSAARLTVRSVRKEWKKDRLENVKDPAIQALFGFVLDELETRASRP